MAAHVKRIDGLRFGRLIAVRAIGYDKNKEIIWMCKCDCGATVGVNGTRLRLGRTTSCGCYRTEQLRARGTHKLTKTRTYRIWIDMWRRCTKPNCIAYKDYGARGITVHLDWCHFERFVEDMGMAEKDMTIDRIDNNGNYEKENCRWVDMKTQSNNKRNNRHLLHCGNLLTVAQWSSIKGILPSTILERLKRGWSVDRALTELPRR